MALTVAYPWDPTGTNAACYIKGECYALSSISNTFRCLIPAAAPFYKKDLEVIHATSGKTLQEGVDYYLGHRYLEVAAIASLDLYGSINFINPELFGEIVLNYRTIGGPFIPVQTKVAEYLANYLIDPVTVSWEDVFNKPEYYPPVDHEQIWSDVVNTEALAASVKEIEDALVAYSVTNTTQSIDVLKTRIAALDQFVTDTEFNNHIVDLTNPHDVSYDQTDALGATEAAVESMKLYAKTLQELAAYINARGITQAQLDAYVSKKDDVFLTKHLKLTDGTAVIRSSGVTSTVALNSGNVVMSCLHTNKILANHDAISDESVYLQAGNNVLRVRSSGAALNNDYLTYNDKVVIHVGNLKQYLGTLNFGTVHVTVVNSATGAWTGIGTAADPLKLSPIIPDASTTVAGSAKLSVATNSTAENAFAVSKALADVMAGLTGYVPVTTTVNGYPLSANITLTKANFGLSLVDNTSDLAKPISTEQQAALDEKSPTDHTHSWNTTSLTAMSTLEAGVAMLATTRTEVTYNKAAAPSLLKVAFDYYTSMYSVVHNTLLQRGSISMIHYIPDGIIDYPRVTQTATGGDIILDGNGDPVLENGEYTYTPIVLVDVQPDSWWVVTLPAGRLYANGMLYVVVPTTLDLEALFGTAPANRTWYIHITADNDAIAKYSIETSILTDTKNRLYVGKLMSSATQVSTDTLTRRVSFGMFQELKDHINATSGVHVYPGDASALVGLDLVENYPLQHYAHQFSPLSIVKTWKHFSFGTNNEAKWITSSDNCGLSVTLSTLSSVVEGRWTHAKMWDRLQPTATAGLTEAKATLRDVIVQKASLSTDIRTYCDTDEIILGVYEDTAGTTHTLSLAFYQSTTDPNVVRSRLYYNKGLASESVIGEYWAPSYGLSFATPPGGVYTAWTMLKMFYDITFSNDNGTKYIEVVLKSGVEWGAPPRASVATNNRTITKFSLADLPTFPYRTELFNSGALGFLTRKPLDHMYSWFNVTTPYSKSAYASANLLMELTKRKLGFGVIQTIANSVNGYELANGSSKAIVLVSPRVVTTASGKGIDKFSTSAFQNSNGDIETLESSYLNASMQQITDGASPAVQTYTITSINFNDEIDLIEVP